jgi:hypothetical protein
MSKRSQKVYCSNACQASARRDTSTKRWLESGEARIDGHQGHYIRQYLADAQSSCCAICGEASTWLGLPLALVGPHRWEPDEQSTGKPAPDLSEL